MMNDQSKRVHFRECICFGRIKDIEAADRWYRTLGDEQFARGNYLCCAKSH